MIALIADTFTLSSLQQTMALFAGAIPALKIIAILLVVLWLLLFLGGEIADALKQRHRRTPSKDNDL